MKIGDSVKLNVNNQENVWVKVTEIEGKNIVGKVDENPIYLEKVVKGDPVKFSEENIIDRMPS